MKLGVPADRVGRLCVASFSGGHVAVREALLDPKWSGRITDLVLADSLYAPRARGDTNALDPVVVKPFVEFARRAVNGKACFVFSHLYPPDPQYRHNTTTLAAEFLLRELKVAKASAGSRNMRGAELLYRAEHSGFHVLGYAGMTNQDHFDHFYALADLLRITSLEAAR